ncbi:MAG: hypothetical protein EHM65_10655, partial [Acidobacteriales bacterium]
MSDAQTKATIDNAMPFVDQKDTLEGFEQINTGTMAIPFIRVLQKLSPQLNRNKPEFVDGAQEGDWYNTLLKRAYGPSIDAVVLKFEHVAIEWRPDRGGFAGYHSMENAERIATAESKRVFGGWKTPEGNSLQEAYVYMVLLADAPHEGLAVVSLSSSAIKTAREWNRLMM